MIIQYAKQRQLTIATTAFALLSNGYSAHSMPPLAEQLLLLLVVTMAAAISGFVSIIVL